REGSHRGACLASVPIGCTEVLENIGRLTGQWLQLLVHFSEAMRIFFFGSGGREHALTRKLRQSPHADQIFCAPGNAGTDEIAENVAIPVSDLVALARFAKQNRVDLTACAP